MPGAEPIFLDRGETGILFLHGFTASPYEGREFAEYFSKKNYTVWVPLLAGHGTRPGDLLSITWQDWYRDARTYFFKLRQKCKKIVVVGQSMGGSLALHLAAHYEFNAVVTLAGAVFLNDWRLKLLPIAKNFVRYQYKSKGPDIRSQAAKRKSVAYHKYPVQSVIQLMRLLDHVREDLMDIFQPILLLHSQKDHVVPFENMNYIFNHVSSHIKTKVALSHSYHILSVDTEKDKVFKEIEKFLNNLKI